MEPTRESRLVCTGIALIVPGLALGGWAAALAFAPVVAGAVECGTILEGVYPRGHVQECLDAAAAQRAWAYPASGSALVLTVGGFAAVTAAALGAERAARDEQHPHPG